MPPAFVGRWGQCFKDGGAQFDRLIIATDHHAVPFGQAPHTAAGAAIQHINPFVGQLITAPQGFFIVAVVLLAVIMVKVFCLDVVNILVGLFLGAIVVGLAVRTMGVTYIFVVGFVLEDVVVYLADVKIVAVGYIFVGVGFEFKVVVVDVAVVIAETVYFFVVGLVLEFVVFDVASSFIVGVALDPILITTAAAVVGLIDVAIAVFV